MLCDYGCGQEARYTIGNGKLCCSKHYNSCPELRRKNSNSVKKSREKEKELGIKRYSPQYLKVKCQYCDRITTQNMIKRHEKFCYLNPLNIKLCPVCNKPVKDYKNATTCSQQCGQRYFRSMFDKVRRERNMSWIDDLYDGGSHYKTICFRYHEKKCIICGEDIAVSVHHYDGNHDNNKPENLVPLCMNHHVYIHSTVENMYIIKECVDEYVKEYCKKNNLMHL
jgi:hypothetical protein